MSQHRWIHHRHDPFGSLDGKPGALQHFRCEHCDVVQIMFDNGILPETFGCKGGAVKPPLPPREKSPFIEKKDYPAKKKR